MTGPEHYDAAEAALEKVEADSDGGYTEGHDLDLARAQVHATLALVAATIEDSDHYRADWRDVLS